MTGGTVPVVLIPGAGGQGWVWHLVEADLRRRGYDAFAVDLPAADEGKGLRAYANAVVAAIGDRDPVDGWPDVPISAVAGRDDRFFPLELQQRVTRERLGIDAEVVPGGHLAALSRPADLTAALDRYLRGAA